MNTYIKMIAVAISAMFIVSLLPAICTSPENIQINDIQNEQTVAEEARDYSKVTFTDRSTIIFSNAGDCTYADNLKGSTSKIAISNDLSLCTSNQIAVIDGDWISAQNKEIVTNQTHDLIFQGTPVITVANSPELLIDSNKNGFSSYAADAKVYGIYTDPSTGDQYCMSVVCEDIDEALLRAYNWADNMISENSTSSSYDDETNLSWSVKYGCETFYQCINKDNKDFGWANIRTHHYKLLDVSDDYEYYYTQFKLDIIPNENRLTGSHPIAIADSTIRSDVRADPTYGEYQEMMRYSPVRDSGISSAHIYPLYTAEFKPDAGVSTGGNVNDVWSYSVSDIVVHDKSLIGEKLEMWYDINENAAVGKTTCVIEPEHVVRCKNIDGGDGKYHATDKYEIVFITFAFWHDFFDTFTFDLNTIVPPSLYPST